MTNFWCRTLVAGSIAISLLATLNQPATATPARTDKPTAERSTTEDTIRELLNLSKSVPASDFERIIDARGFGLSDDVTLSEVAEAQARKEFADSVKMYDWPGNLPSKEMQKLQDRRNHAQLCYSNNLPDTASEEELRRAIALHREQSSKLMDEYQEIYSKKLPKDLENQACEKVMAKEKELTRAGHARAVDLLPTASWEQIKSAEADTQRKLSIKLLDISPNSNQKEIDAAYEKRHWQEKALIARRVFKSPANTSDAQLLTNLKILAKALDYPTKVDSRLNMTCLTSRVILATAVGTQSGKP